MDPSESKEADDPQIRVMDLRNDISDMRFAGFWPDKVECGPIVFDFLIGLAIITNKMLPSGDYWTEDRLYASEEAMRQEMLSGAANIEFEGMPVVLCDDVPDGRLWPTRDRGGFVVKPFPGTEAYLAI